MSQHATRAGRHLGTLVIDSAKDVTDAVNTGRVRGGHEKAIVIIALGGVFIDAYDFTSLSVGMSDVTKTFDLGALGTGIVAASIMVGALIGALAGGYLVDRFGRYKLFMADMVFFVIAALGCAVAWNAEVLTLFRFLMGFGIGLDFPVALAFIAEYSRHSGKGGRVSLWATVWYIATAISFAILIPLYFLLEESAHGQLWRWAVGFGAVPALVVMLVRHRYMAESPAWAAKQGDLEGAAAILRKSYGVDAVVAPGAAERAVADRPAPTNLRAYATLFNRRYRGRTILASITSACQSMQYFAVGFYLPTIMVTLFHQSRLTSITFPIAFNVLFGVTGGLLGVWLTNRLGSWRLLTIGFTVCTVVLLALGVVSGDPSDTMIASIGLLLGLFVFFHAFGPGAQTMTMATLSYPTSLRGVGSGFGQASVRVGSTISLLLFPVLSKGLGDHVFFAVAVAPILGLVALLLIRWNPIGRDIDAEDYVDGEAVAAATPEPQGAVVRADRP